VPGRLAVARPIVISLIGTARIGVSRSLTTPVVGRPGVDWLDLAGHGRLAGDGRLVGDVNLVGDGGLVDQM
jgi:hypothetical protein